MRSRPLCAAVAAVTILCGSCAGSTHRGPSTTRRTIAASLVVRTTLAPVSTIRRPLRWALAMRPAPTAVRAVVFAVDGRTVGIAHAAPFACCPGQPSYLAGLSPGRHTFVCTVHTADHRTSRETVTAAVVARHSRPDRGESS